MTALAANGSRIGFVTPGFQDHFNRPDGSLGNGWVDMVDTWPTMFDPMFLVSGEVKVTPVTPVIPGGAFNVAHGCVYRDIGLTDNVEFGIRWSTPELLATVPQISPAGWINPSSSDVKEMGVVYYNDISIARNYAANAFRCPIGSVGDVSNYTAIGSLHVWDAMSYGAGVTHWLAVRCVSGMMTGYQDGVAQWGPVAKPAWATTSLFGLHYVCGDNYPIGPAVGFYARNLA